MFPNVVTKYYKHQQSILHLAGEMRARKIKEFPIKARSHSLRRLDVGEGHSRRGHSRQSASSTAGLRSKEAGSHSKA
eukprot:329655-Amphidinium_carterae.1